MEIPVSLAVEDELGEHLLRIVLQQSKREYLVGLVYGKQGFGYLKRMANAFNNASRGAAHLLLTDLDTRPCPVNLIEEWFACPLIQFLKIKNANFLFRIAVREVESWIMADREKFAELLGISLSRIPTETDLIPDPKKMLLELASKCRKRDLREDLVRISHSLLERGPDYNGRLAEFLYTSWRVHYAKRHSQSLMRTCETLDSFMPIYTTKGKS